jgi:ribosomal-protein-alanine N-acetyltransferase
MATVAASLRAATKEDVPGLAQLERAAFETPNWPAETFLHYECTIAEVDGQMAGFLVARQTFAGSQTALPEREILNLAVAPAFRRAGIAKLLLNFEFRHRAIFLLEVRESNVIARTLYEQLGFAEIARRRDYYDHPPETAIVMQLKLFPS